MKQIKKLQKNHAVLVTILAALIFAFSLSCGSQEEAETEEQPQEKTTQVEARVQELETEIEQKNEAIAELEEEAGRLETQVPVSRAVMLGDSHWGIAYDYLTQEEGLSSEEARQYLSDALLFHPILVGFRVWNYFNEGIFGSFVTQGTADVSPGAVMRAEKKEAAETKEQLQNRIENLKTENQQMGEKLDQMQAQYTEEKDQFQSQIDSLQSDLNEARGDIQELESALSSVYYLADMKNSLKREEIIKGTFLGICGKRIGDITPADFDESVDLNQADRITLNAGDLGVNRIDRVDLLPKHYKLGEDYRIEFADGGQSADVLLLNQEKFRMAQLIIIIN